MGHREDLCRTIDTRDKSTTTKQGYCKIKYRLGHTETVYSVKFLVCLCALLSHVFVVHQTTSQTPGLKAERAFSCSSTLPKKGYSLVSPYCAGHTRGEVRNIYSGSCLKNANLKMEGRRRETSS